MRGTQSKSLLSVTLVVLALALVYLVTHLSGLTKLPIFADEAIYIRWSQLIISDAQQYFFFPINDGKTPLFIWMLVPFVKTLIDPLWAGRLLSIIGGLIQVGLIALLLRELGVKRVGMFVGSLIVIFAPFWFFHHRMVLMDGWLTVWLSLATLAVLRLTVEKQSRDKVMWLVVGSLAVWAGLMTKVPFVLAIPALLLLPFRSASSRVIIKNHLIWVAGIIGVGTVLFLTLALTPVFPQLLSRGGDFLLPLSEVLAGRWKETVPSIPTYLGYFLAYAGWGVFALAFAGLVLPGKRRIALLLAVSFILFCAPIWVLGRVVFPRYLFPAMLYLTLLAGIGADTLWRWSARPVHTAVRRRAIRLLLGLLVLQLMLTSARFLVPSWYDANSVPFVSADRSQYLTTWSSGHGLVETYAYLGSLTIENGGNILVATEGNFGSLPDGLLLYNFRSALPNVWIEGIGYPVNWITPEFADRIQPQDRVILVVNDDRLLWSLDENTLLREFCRPAGGPCLQIWDITESYPQFKKR